MKKNTLFIWLLIVYCITSGLQVQAEEGQEVTEEVTIDEGIPAQPSMEVEQALETRRYARTGNGSDVILTDLDTYLASQFNQQKTTIDLSVYQIHTDEMEAVFEAVINRHPEIYFVDPLFNMHYGQADLVVTKIDVTYRDYDRDALEAEVQKSLSFVEEEWSDLEKVIAIHDFLCTDVVYPYQDLQDNTLSANVHNLWGAVMDKSAVCDGYARAFMFYMQRVGVPCQIVTSDHHAWNQVQVDGHWYMVDTTYDDPSWDRYGNVKHTYLMVSAEKMKQIDQANTSLTTKHVWEEEQFEACEDTAYDEAFWTNSITQLLYQEGYWYIAGKDGQLYKHSFTEHAITSLGQHVRKLAEKWNVFGSTTSRYTTNYVRIAKYYGKLVYTAYDSIWMSAFDDTEGSTAVKIMDVDISTGYVYGMHLRDHTLLYQLSEKPSGGAGTVVTKQLEQTLNVADAEIRTADEALEYNGEEQPSPVVVTFGGTLLTEGEDYTVEYNYPESGTGNVTVTITGKDLFYGTKTATYTITRIPQQVALTQTSISRVYGTVSEPLGATVNGGQLQYVSDNEQVVSVDSEGRLKAVGVGSTVVTVRTEGDFHYGPATAQIAVTVTPAALPDTGTVTGAPFTFTGNDIRPQVVIDGLTQNRDYEITGYVNNRNARSQSEADCPAVLVRGIGNYTGNASIYFTIGKAEPGELVTGPELCAIHYGQTLADSLVSAEGTVGFGDATVSGTFQFTAPWEKPDAAVDGQFEMQFTPDSENFVKKTYRITVQVSPYGTAPNLPSATRIVDYDLQTVSEVVLPDDWAWAAADRNRALPVGEALTVTAVYTGEGKDNYAVNTQTVSVTRSSCSHSDIEIIGREPATCGADGYTGDHRCKHCLQIVQAGTVLPATGQHAFDMEEILEEPTKETEGLKRVTCSVCGATKEVILDKLPEHARAKQDIILASGTVRKTYGTAPFTVGARALGGELSYQSENPAVAQVDAAGMITILNVGQADIVISTEGDETYLPAERTLKLIVSPIELTDQVSLGRTVFTYTGEEICPPVLAPGLTEGADYSVTQENNLNAAAAGGTVAPTVVVTGIGHYTGMLRLPFTIEKAEPGEIADEPGIQKIRYGQKLSDSVTNEAGSVWFGQTKVSGTFRFTAPGTMPDAVTDGMFEMEFTPDSSNFSKKNYLQAVTVQPYGTAPRLPQNTRTVEYAYDTVAKVVLPDGWEWKASDGQLALVAGETTDATAVYTGSGAGNYAVETQLVSITRQACLHSETEKRNAKAATCGAAGYTGDLYCLRCGQLVQPGVELPATGDHHFDEGVVLSEPTKETEGQRRVTCQDCGHEEVWMIDKLPEHARASQVVRLASGSLRKTYGDAPFEIGAQIQGGSLSYQSQNTEVVTVDATGLVTVVGVGSATVLIRTEGNEDYLPAEAELVITVEGTPLPTGLALPNAVFTYTGSAVRPEVTVEGLEEDRDYAISYENNLNAADAGSGTPPAVVVTGIGHYAGIKRLVFTIEKAEPGEIAEAPELAAIHYGQTLGESMVDAAGTVWFLGERMDGTFRFTAASSKPEPRVQTTYEVEFTPQNANLKKKYYQIDVEVTPYGTAPQLPQNVRTVEYETENVKAVALPDGWEWSEESAALSLKAGEKTYATAVFTGSGAGNYAVETQKVEITRLVCTHSSTEKRGAKTATCGENGYTGDIYCLRCGALVSNGAVLSATGKHSYDGGVVVEEPSLEKEGRKRFTCQLCGAYEDEVLEKLSEQQLLKQSIETGSDILYTTWGAEPFLIAAKSQGGILKYVSEKEDVVKVDALGTVTAVKPGTSVVTISTDGDSTYLPAEKKLTIVVRPKELPVQAVILQNTYVYTGQEIRPEVSVEGMASGTDYEVGYVNNTDAASEGSANAPAVIVSGKGNYTGTQKITFTIEKAEPEEIAEAPELAAIHYGQTLGESMTDASGTVWFRGERIEGTFRFTSASAKPEPREKKQYEVEFTPSNVNLKKKYYQIDVEVQPYGTAPQLPGNTRIVEYETETVQAVVLPDGWEWDKESAALALKPGEKTTAVAVYTGSGAGNYAVETQQVEITRQACLHSSTEKRGVKTATCGENGYTGDIYCLRCGGLVSSGVVLPATGAHSYDNGVILEEPTLEKEGRKRFTCLTCGAVTEEILEKLSETKRAQQTIDTGTDTFYKTWGDAPFVLAAKVQGGTLEYASADETVVKVDASGTVTVAHPGTAVVTISTAGDSAYLPAETKVKVVVKPKELSGEAALAQDTFVYTGNEIQPGVSLEGLVPGADYEVSFENNQDAAPSVSDHAPTVVVTGKGDYTGTQRLPFTIEKAEPGEMAEPPQVKAIYYGQALKDGFTQAAGKVKFGDALVEGTFRFVEPDLKPNVSDDTKHEVIFTPASSNFKEKRYTVEVRVLPYGTAPGLAASLRTVDYQYDTVGKVVLPDNWSWSVESAKLALPVGTALQATAVFTGEHADNYEVGKQMVVITRLACGHAHTEKRNARSATCGEEGYTGDWYCTDCGEIVVPGVTLPVTGVHIWDAGTDTEDGLVYTCEICGMTRTDSQQEGESGTGGQQQAGTEESHGTGNGNISSATTEGQTATAQPVGSVQTTEKKTQPVSGQTEKVTTEAPVQKVTTEEATEDAPTVTKNSPTALNLKNKASCRSSFKLKIKDTDGISKVVLNGKIIKKNYKKTTLSFRLSKYKKLLKKKGKWNKLVVTDGEGKKKTVKFKLK